MIRFLTMALFLCISAPAIAQQKPIWQFDAGNGDPLLVYGVPESDDTLLSLTCQPQSGNTVIFVPETRDGIEPDTKVSLVLTAGKARATLAGLTISNEEAAIPSLSATTPTSNPIIAALGKAHTLNVDAAGRKFDIPLQDLETKLTQFLAVCAKK